MLSTCSYFNPNQRGSMEYIVETNKNIRVGNVEYGKIFKTLEWVYMKINDQSLDKMPENKCYAVLLTTGFVERFDPNQKVEVLEQVEPLILR